MIGAIAQRFRFELVPGTMVVPEPLVTLRPKNGIRMKFHAREAFDPCSTSQTPVARLWTMDRM